MLGKLVDVPFAFDRKRVYTDKKALLRDFARVLEKTRGRGLKIDTLSVGGERMIVLALPGKTSNRHRIVGFAD